MSNTTATIVMRSLHENYLMVGRDAISVRSIIKIQRNVAPVVEYFLKVKSLLIVATGVGKKSMIREDSRFSEKIEMQFRIIELGSVELQRIEN